MPTPGKRKTIFSAVSSGARGGSYKSRNVVWNLEGLGAMSPGLIEEESAAEILDQTRRSSDADRCSRVPTRGLNEAAHVYYAFRGGGGVGVARGQGERWLRQNVNKPADLVRSKS